MIGKTIAELHPGERAEMARVVEEDDIASFIDAVGDLNSVHSDVDFAATTPFKSPIAPGVFTAGLISAVIGTRLPGPGAVYLSQSLKFVKPVRAGDTITARVDVLEVLVERNRVRLQTVCVNQRGEEVNRRAFIATAAVSFSSHSRALRSRRGKVAFLGTGHTPK
jgi:3-hydroxybutyryl-CoA dehydratase